MGLLLIGIALAVVLTHERRWHTLCARRVVAPALLAGAIALTWYAVLLARMPAAIQQLVQYALLPLGGAAPHGSAGHFEPPWYYLRVAFSVGWPALWLLPLVVIHARAVGLRSRASGSSSRRSRSSYSRFRCCSRNNAIT
jgi:4-amino-4-deoxy-L-arabinose transferase-like glycosyltransferase